MQATGQHGAGLANARPCRGIQIMKITIDLDRLLEEGRINEEEYRKFSTFNGRSIGMLAFNILVGFGVITVSSAALALVPDPSTAIGIGALTLAAGLYLRHERLAEWKVLAGVCVLVGALMSGGGIIAADDVSSVSFVMVAALFTFTSIFARSSMLAVLAVFSLASSIGTKAAFFPGIQEPLITVGLFSLFAWGLHQLATRLDAVHAPLAIAASRTSVFLANLGFWIGSLWGERNADGIVVIDDWIIAIAWAVALLATAAWAWSRNRRRVLNVAVVFAGIHFYSQWFEYLGTSPSTVLVAGILALSFAIGLRHLNGRLPIQC